MRDKNRPWRTARTLWILGCGLAMVSGCQPAQEPADEESAVAVAAAPESITEENLRRHVGR